MRKNFDIIMAMVIGHEGGYVNDPRDPGGETNWGISKRSYPKVDIRNLTRKEALAIYDRDYWVPTKCDDLPSGVDYAVFDAAINSGVRRSIQWLQDTVGVEADGKIGPITLSAVNKYDNKAVLVDRLLDRRLAFMKAAKGPKGESLWATYSRGWSNRIKTIRPVATKMAREG